MKQTLIVPFEDHKKQAPEFNLESVNQQVGMVIFGFMIERLH